MAHFLGEDQPLRRPSRAPGISVDMQLCGGVSRRRGCSSFLLLTIRSKEHAK